MTLVHEPPLHNASYEDFPGDREPTLGMPEAARSNVDVEAELTDLKIATEAFVEMANTYPIVETGDARTTVTLYQGKPRHFKIGEGEDAWQPGRVFHYSSEDPWQKANPELTRATNRWIQKSMDIARRLKAHATATGEASQDEVKIAYDDNIRKRKTAVTETIAQADPGVAGIGGFIDLLPRAPALRPVARPWEPLTLMTKDGIKEYPTSRAMEVMARASGDGEAVREREDIEATIVTSLYPESIENGELVITSIGTGTGEPIMEASLGLARRVREQGGTVKRVLVHGLDGQKPSLDVATHLAEQKAAALPDGETLEFVPHPLMNAEQLAKFIRDNPAKVLEAVGLAEYLTSENATDPYEKELHEKMMRLGAMSIEKFISVIFENMPEGSVFITGNMLSNSPQGEFVEDCLGWPRLLRRSTETYLEIFRSAGVPGRMIDLFVPDPEHSSATYNMVAMWKLPPTPAERKAARGKHRAEQQGKRRFQLLSRHAGRHALANMPTAA